MYKVRFKEQIAIPFLNVSQYVCEYVIIVYSLSVMHSIFLMVLL